MAPKDQPVTNYFQAKMPDKMIGDIYLLAAAWHSIENNVPFTRFESPSHRAMFLPFHENADKIVTRAHRGSVREQTKRLGSLTRDATK